MEIANLLKQEAGRIGKDIGRRALLQNVWNALVPQDKFPEEMGHTLSVMTYERSLPRHSSAGDGTLDTTGLKWRAVTQTDAGALPYGLETKDSTNVNATQTGHIDFRTKLEQYNLQRTFVESPRFDMEDLRIAVHRATQIQQIDQILSENTIWAWQERYRDEYMRLAKYAVILDAAIDYSALNAGTGDPFVGVLAANVPTLELAQTHLDRVHSRLVLSGAGQFAHGQDSGRPVFTLLTHPETSDNVLTQADIKSDFRESSRVDEVLKPFGINRNYRGWHHINDDLAPRYALNDAETALERVDPYVRSAVDGSWDVNPAYETAPFEAAIVFSKSVYTSLMPAPNVGGSKIKFEAQNFKGDFRFVNILSEDKNPDGTNGYFRGILASASKPFRREHGYVILHKRAIMG